MNAAGPNYPTASLFVGNLHPEVTEAMLFEKFSKAGPIVSIRVCWDPLRTLGYAYVNFQQPADAERALDTMNFDAIKGQPILIMWSQHDPTLRRSGLGNVSVKNLDKSFDNKAMYDTFSAFGNILSCKVATDENGENRGYGFVKFETEESALTAIKKVNGMLLNGRKVYVGKFIPRRERSSGTGDHARKYTDVFIKNFGVELGEEDLRTICESYGKVLSLKMISDMAGKSRGFAFVSFESHDAANMCVEDMDGKEQSGRQLFAFRAVRNAELCARFEAIRQERSNRFHGVNLYIKNLDDDIDDERLRKEFARFGNITSAKVMKNDKEVSRGFGFVCFSSREEATKAVTEMNNRIISVKPLYVALAQRKEVEQAQLAAQDMRLNMNYRVPDTHEIPQQAVHVPGQAPLTAQMLAQAQPHEQKQMLGERLFSIIQQSHGDVADKITGILLEMDNADLLHMLESDESLKAKISEALSVLAVHQQKEQKKIAGLPNAQAMRMGGATATQRPTYKFPQGPSGNKSSGAEASYASVKVEGTLLEECETPDVSQESILAADYGRLMVNVADDLTLDSTLKLAILFGLPPAEIDMIRRVSLIETPGLTLIKFMKTRNIINMYDVTNLQKGLVHIHLNQTNENLLAPYQSKVDPFQFEENQSPELLDWPV